MGFSSQYAQNKLIEDEIIHELITIQDNIEDERARGVLRQIQGKGFSSLSKKQQYVYNQYIEPIRASRFMECLICSQRVDTEFAFEINDGEGCICENCWE